MRSPAGRRCLRVLLVEDEPANRALVRAVVERANRRGGDEMVLVEAASMAQARARLTDEHLDLVLLDVRLSDGNGLDLAAEIRDGAREDRPRVVVLSASVLPVEQSTALAMGADAFLAKPFAPDDLVAILRGASA